MTISGIDVCLCTFSCADEEEVEITSWSYSSSSPLTDTFQHFVLVFRCSSDFVGDLEQSDGAALGHGGLMRTVSCSSVCRCVSGCCSCANCLMIKPCSVCVCAQPLVSVPLVSDDVDVSVVSLS